MVREPQDFLSSFCKLQGKKIYCIFQYVKISLSATMVHMLFSRTQSCLLGFSDVTFVWEIIVLVTSFYTVFVKVVRMFLSVIIATSSITAHCATGWPRVEII